jgi:hypothetical protein
LLAKDTQQEHGEGRAAQKKQESVKAFYSPRKSNIVERQKPHNSQQQMTT